MPLYKYEHGGDVYSPAGSAVGAGYVDFSANINPLGLPVGVKAALKQAILQCPQYPDPFCRALREVTADFLQVPGDCLFFGNGAADVIFRLALTLKPRKALLLAPTFSDYEKALATVGCEIKYYFLNEETSFEPQADILDAVDESFDLVVICNPNNPTGKLIGRPLLEQLLARCAGLKARLLVDECFMDFVSKEKAYSMTGLLAEYPALVILKAFTKTFAMPGVRLGYCLSADAGLFERMYRNGQDWSVSVLAQRAGTAALQERDYLVRSHALIEKERVYLARQLSRLGARLYGSEANYVFFYLSEPKDLKEKLRERGFLIRSCENYRGLGLGYYRIAVKTRTLNRKIIKAIKEAREDALITGTN